MDDIWSLAGFCIESFHNDARNRAGSDGGKLYKDMMGADGLLIFHFVGSSMSASTRKHSLMEPGVTVDDHADVLVHQV